MRQSRRHLSSHLQMPPHDLQFAGATRQLRLIMPGSSLKGQGLGLGACCRDRLEIQDLGDVVAANPEVDGCDAGNQGNCRRYCKQSDDTSANGADTHTCSTITLWRGGCTTMGRMINFTNNPAAHRYCDGLSRRGFLKAGTLAIGGFALADLLKLQANGAIAPNRGG